MKLEVVYRSTDELIPYAMNSRTHTDNQVMQLAASIKEFGFTNPVLIDEDGGIIAGHGRVMAAKRLQMDELPTITLEGMTEAQRWAYVIADNKLAMNSDWDYEALKAELERIGETDLDLGLLGFGDAELETLLGGELDLDILDELDDEEVDEFEDNVKKAIQIEFEAEDYEEAKELVSFWRSQDAYVGGLIVDYLRKEKNKL